MRVEMIVERCAMSLEDDEGVEAGVPQEIREGLRTARRLMGSKASVIGGFLTVASPSY
jgi:hypothetical protein